MPMGQVQSFWAVFSSRGRANRSPANFQKIGFNWPQQPVALVSCLRKVNHSGLRTVHYDAWKDSEQGLVTLPKARWTMELWKEDGLDFKSSWATPTLVDVLAERMTGC